jgi:acetylornithine deacetylase/succinyl-diaminopimelate desuccinylase-like protein
MYDILRRRNNGLQELTVAFARRLVATTGYSGQEANVAKEVRQKMLELEYDKVMRDDFGNVIGIMEGRAAEPTILLTCHMDTAPAGERGQWQRDPFSAEIADGKLFGCGASDCKGGLAAQIFAGALLRRSLLPLRGNLVVAATTCEENGTSAGIRHLLDTTLPELAIKPTYAVLGEPTNLGLYYGHDGWIEVNIDIKSTDLPGVDDAAENIFTQLTALATEEGETLQNFLAQAPVFETDQGTRQARIRLNRRLADHEQIDSVVNQVKRQATQAVNQSETVTVEVAVSCQQQQSYTGLTTVARKVTHAWTTDPFCTLMERSRQALEAAGCNVHPGKWELGRIGMATAGGVLTHDYDIPTIGYGPGNEAFIHAPNEYVEVNKIAEATYGTASIAHSLIGIPVFGWTSDEI